MDMASKKKWLIVAMMTSLSLSFPIQSLANDQANTSVGIGFSNQATPTPTPDPPTQKNNIIPMTSSSYTPRRGRLPQTGGLFNHYLQLMGIGFILLSFWLFLFLRLKKEEDAENGCQ